MTNQANSVWYLEGSFVAPFEILEAPGNLPGQRGQISFFGPRSEPRQYDVEVVTFSITDIELPFVRAKLAVIGPSRPARPGMDGPTCIVCGGMTRRTGTCYTCIDCATTTGCG